MAEIGFEPAKYILLIVYEQIRKTTDTYQNMVEALTTLARSRPETEINLNVLLGRKDPTTREEADFLNRYFPSLNNVARQALFKRLKVSIPDDLKIHFGDGGDLLHIWITDTGNNSSAHCSIPKNPTSHGNTTYHNLIHMTEDIGQKGKYYHEYYQWDDPKRIQIKEPIGGPVNPNAGGLAFELKTSPQSSPSDGSGGNTVHTYVDSGEVINPGPRERKLYISTDPNDKNYYTLRSGVYSVYPQKKRSGGKRRSTRRRRALRKTRKAYI